MKLHKVARLARPGRRALATQSKIVWTYTDEAPALATFALLPVIERFTKPAGLAVELADISVARRILSQFSDRLKPEQRVPDTLAELGELAKTPDANIVKVNAPRQPTTTTPLCTGLLVRDEGGAAALLPVERAHGGGAHSFGRSGLHVETGTPPATPHLHASHAPGFSAPDDGSRLPSWLVRSCPT